MSVAEAAQYSQLSKVKHQYASFCGKFAKNSHDIRNIRYYSFFGGMYPDLVNKNAKDDSSCLLMTQNDQKKEKALVYITKKG